jgi:hypothetical protein
MRSGGSIGFDEGRFPVTVLVDLCNEWNCFVELIHSTFLCPRTGYRTTKLFLPNGSRHFWSRRAYRLGYGRGTGR